MSVIMNIFPSVIGLHVYIILVAVADPGSVKRGPGIQIPENIPEKTPENNKNRPKKQKSAQQSRPNGIWNQNVDISCIP